MRGCLIVVLLFVLGCNQHTPTPAGTSIASKSDFEQVAGKPTTFEKEVTLDGTPPSKIKVIADVMEGRQFSNIEIQVVESGGWEMSSGNFGNPFNAGSEDAAIMAIPVIVTRFKVEGCGQHMTQSSLTLRSDGKVEVD